MKFNSILTKLIFLIAIVEFLIMVLVYEYFKPLHSLMEKHVFLGPIIDTFILVLIITLAYRKVLKRPLDELLRVMEAIEKKDFSVKADEKRKDELGVIAIYFNRVSDKLKTWGTDLERQVQEQTKELRSTNRELIASNEELHATADRLRSANEELIELKSGLEKKLSDLEQIKKVLSEKERQIEELKKRIA